MAAAVRVAVATMDGLRSPASPAGAAMSGGDNRRRNRAQEPEEEQPERDAAAEKGALDGLPQLSFPQACCLSSRSRSQLPTTVINDLRRAVTLAQEQ